MRFSQASVIGGLFFLSVLSEFTRAAEVPAGPDHFECGNYTVSGVLKTHNDEAEILEIYPGTTRRFDLVVRGLSLEQQTSLAGQPLSVQVYIYKKGKGGEARSRIDGTAKIIALYQALEKPIEFVKKRNCFEK